MAKRISSFVLLLFLLTGVFAQEAPSIFQGTWTATAGPNRVFRGTWSAQPARRRPNSALGSWTLLNDAGEIVLQGTWSAEKSGKGWHGTWTARTLQSQSFSGSWTADIADLRPKTLADMLGMTAGKQVAGGWRSGRYQGNWWLKGSPPQSRPR